MNPLVIVVLAGPLIAFATAINFAFTQGDAWTAVEMLSVLTLAAVIGVAFARFAFAAAGSGLPF
jgi:hypothetical protein